MKIIKQGKTKEELKAILNKTKRFECKMCGCIFEADEGEYIEEDCFYSFSFYCKCPNCGKIAIEKHGKTEKVRDEGDECFDNR